MASIWSDERQPRPARASSPLAEPDPTSWRSRFQQDYDRVLFSTPVRRLSDKMQVWPMDENDGVRTRLTHSHEVANLARSIGSRVADERPEIFNGIDFHKVIQPILSAIGLVHDLGNPPFGHQGEIAIGRWFKARHNWIFSQLSENESDLPVAIPESLRGEFTDFDGNPQTFRLITTLQTHLDYVGLDLTSATLAASLKYPVSAATRNSDKPVCKKIGYFQSESKLVDWVRENTGLDDGKRHPLTWIMEACDDIAYSVLDVDDAMKKGVVSPDDVLAILEREDLNGSSIVQRLSESYSKASKASDNRPIEVIRDVKVGYVRAYLIEALIKEAVAQFIQESDSIMSLRFWTAIVDRQDYGDLGSRRSSPKARFGYSLISPNYLDNAIRSGTGAAVEGSIRYCELRLLTDMISGMTDTFAIKLWREVKGIPDCP